MNMFSRRAILRAGAASVAVLTVSPASRLVAQTLGEQRTIESELTGSVIELIDDNWNFSLGFGGMEEGDGYLRELYLMDTETCALEVEFVQSTLSPEEYADVVLERYRSNWDQFELADSGTTGDGHWFAASAVTGEVSVSVYCEYQTGAFEEADLMVSLLSEPSAFTENLPQAQQGVLIGDLEPFLMIEPSEVLSLAFPALAVATATETSGRATRSSRSSGETTEGRTTRSSRSAGESSEPDGETSSTRSNRRRPGQSSATTDGDFVAAVRSHQADFLLTLGDFVDSVAILADESTAEAELNEAFDTIGRVAEMWLTYPEQASQLSAPPEFAELGSLYLEWANEIGALGNAWFDFIGGTGTVDDLFGQLDVVQKLDQDLTSSLGSQ